MERRLIIMRHAKSSWDSDAPTDHARPLNKRGRKDAPRVAQRLKELGWMPELVVSSDSQRTRETWARMEPIFMEDIPVELRRELYGGGADEITESALEWPDSVGTVLVLGHNPGWEYAVATFSGIHEAMTTANAALLAGIGDDWYSALGGRWHLTALLRPKEL